jgi:excisionase family DNA binding protein
MSTRFLTENEVAERTQISLGTLRRWRLENKGPRYHKFGSLVRYSEDDLTIWQETQPRGGDDTQRVGSASARFSSSVRKLV